MRYGYKASAEQFESRRLLDFSLLAERSGLDTITVSDHFQPWRHHGGHAPAAMTWLGGLAVAGDGAMLGTSVLTPTMRYHPSIVAQSFATIARLTDAPVFLGRMIEIKVSYDTDAEQAERACRWWGALALTSEEKTGVEDPLELERLADAHPERAASRFIVSADPDEVVERIAPYVELGFTELVFHGPGDDQARFIGLFTRDVLPRLRERWGQG